MVFVLSWQLPCGATIAWVACPQNNNSYVLNSPISSYNAFGSKLFLLLVALESKENKLMMTIISLVQNNLFYGFWFEEGKEVLSISVVFEI